MGGDKKRGAVEICRGSCARPLSMWGCGKCWWEGGVGGSVVVRVGVVMRGWLCEDGDVRVVVGVVGRW